METLFTKDDIIQFKKHYRLFIDLDGVLADFDSGVYSVLGKFPKHLHVPFMWSRLAKTPDFYNTLPWMIDGRILWNGIKDFSPVILTGIPRGKWAIPQKTAWCERELGKKYDVITCYTREKPERAEEICEEGIIPVLIDDRIKIMKEWQEMGGIFIRHFSASESLEAVKALMRTAYAAPDYIK